MHSQSVVDQEDVNQENGMDMKYVLAFILGIGFLFDVCVAIEWPDLKGMEGSESSLTEEWVFYGGADRQR